MGYQPPAAKAMVEVAGVEPASENMSKADSTCLAIFYISLICGINRQTCQWASRCFLSLLYRCQQTQLSFYDIHSPAKTTSSEVDVAVN